MSQDDVAGIERACTRLVLDFARYADTGEYEKVGELFTQDGLFARRGETFRGGGAITEAIDAMLQNRLSSPHKPWWRVRHFCTNVQIDVESPTRATGRAYYTIYRYQGDPVEGVPPITGPALIGDYVDEFVLTAAGWRIARREIRPAFFNPGA